MKKHVWYKAVIFFALLTALCGGAYVAVVTGMSWALFPRQAQGNAYVASGINYGNAYLGQPFADEGHLWGRVMLPDFSAFTSSTSNASDVPTVAPMGEGAAEGEVVAEDEVAAGESAVEGEEQIARAYFYARPSNDAPTSADFEQRIKRVASTYASTAKQLNRAVPVDLVTCSGSGLDPDISPASAYYQVPRIAQATGLSQQRITTIIRLYTTQRFLGIFGEPHVNVLKVNIALDTARNLSKERSN